MKRPAPRELLAGVLNCAPESLTDTSGLARHPKWDSFAHLNIMVALEEHYGVEINDATIRKFDTFSAIEAYHAGLGTSRPPQ